MNAEIETSIQPNDAYPCRDEVFYGRGVWPMGEEGDVGLLVEGHGRRALAAVSAHERSMRGYGGWSRMDGWPGAIEKWVQIVETCGCTEEQHEAHVVDEDGWCSDHCDDPGLPPCDERFGWMIKPAVEGDPGAVAVTQVTW